MNSARKSPLVRASTRRPVPPVATALSPMSPQGDRRSWAQASAAPLVDGVLRTPGQPLDLATRVLMESRLGHQFSRVRVHADDRAAASAREQAARDDWAPAHRQEQGKPFHNGASVQTV